jgi:hypothetical protein
MSVKYSFADFWQQNELSDVTVVVAAPDGTELSQLPGHGIILSQSPYCRAQVLRDDWHPAIPGPLCCMHCAALIQC